MLQLKLKYIFIFLYGQTYYNDSYMLLHTENRSINSFHYTKDF